MVSVLLLSWNHEKYIEQAIRSLARQTYKDIEVIFLDNNSTDGTFDIAKELLSDSGMVHSLSRRETNFGISANYNFLFHKSKGEYLCLLSGDDWLHKDSIAEKVNAFNDDPDMAMVHSGGHKYYQEMDVYEPLKVINYPSHLALSELLKNNYISSTGILLRKSAVEAVGGWNEFLIAEDGELWIRLLSKYKIGSVDRFLYYYRQHANNISSNADFMYSAHMEIYESSKHLNQSKNTARRNITDHYLSVKVKNATTFPLFMDVIKHFRFEKIYFRLLLKSMLPVSWKQWYFKRSFRKKYRHVVIDE